MRTLRRLYARLRLRVNETKSAVTRPWDRKFLGYGFWVVKGGAIRRRVARQALDTMKERVRHITRRNGERSLASVAEELRARHVSRRTACGAHAHRWWRMAAHRASADEPLRRVGSAETCRVTSVTGPLSPPTNRGSVPEGNEGEYEALSPM